MPDREQTTLNRMESGQSGKVVQIQGGYGLINRLGALGIRHGKRISKVSSMFMRGPVTIQVGNAQVAIGFGMAEKIIVELGESRNGMPQRGKK
ncbi:ferrous iron transport protein A [Chloroflexota bacterium]